MTAANQNPPTTKLHRMTPEQMASYLLIEHALVCLQSAANQAGGFLKQTDAGDALLEAQALLGKRRDELLEKWDRKIQIAPAGAIINGSVITDKAH